MGSSGGGQFERWGMHEMGSSVDGEFTRSKVEMGSSGDEDLRRWGV